MRNNVLHTRIFFPPLVYEIGAGVKCLKFLVLMRWVYHIFPLIAGWKKKVNVLNCWVHKMPQSVSHTKCIE